MHDEKTMEGFKAMMDGLMAEKEKELGLGSEEFLQRHEEIMEMCDRIDQIQKEARAKEERPMMDAQDVSEALSVARSTAYQIIRQLNEELEKKGYITVRGKVSRAYFKERTYGAKTTA